MKTAFVILDRMCCAFADMVGAIVSAIGRVVAVVFALWIAVVLIGLLLVVSRFLLGIWGI